MSSPHRPDHIRLTFHLEKPRATVWFCDTRRLGKIGWFAARRGREPAFARSHGPDALEIGRDELAERLTRTTRGIKPTLMDQKVLAGIGNIYADEILFRAGSTPSGRPRRSPATSSIDCTARSARSWPRRSPLEGSSFDAGYRTVLGLEGGFLAQNSVYGRANQPCRTCEKPIMKTKIAGLIGRPTYYCPACQVRE